MLLALLAVVPLTLDRVRLLENSRTERLEIARTEVLSLARRAVESESEMIEATRAVLRVASRLYETTAGHPGDCPAALAGVAADVPWILSLVVVGPDDRVACSNLKRLEGLDLSDRAFIRKAREQGGFVLSEQVLDRTNGAPAVIAAQLAPGPGPQGAAILAARIDLRWIGRTSSAIARHAGAAAVLLDGQGTVLAAVPDREEGIGTRFADPSLLTQMLSQAEGQAAMPWSDGERRIGAFARLPGTDSLVVVGLNEYEVLSRIDREIGIAYLQLVMFGLLTLLAAWFGGEQLIVEPIRALTRVAIRIGRGELDARPSGQVWAVEFAPLVSALADMGRQLSERDRELRSANRHLETLASIDCLSGLANRRSFDAHLEAEWQRAALTGRPLGLMMIDVDHFKLFNDNNGHVEGDRCLQMFGGLLANLATGADFAARYGGEEFALLMPETDLAHAMRLAERLRAEVAGLGIVHRAAPAGVVTISVGVACLLPADGEPPRVLIEAADAGLYQAKRTGRNKVATEAPALVPGADGAVLTTV
jgi:diguanylate cyclase (GGDEF)-like protein